MLIPILVAVFVVWLVLKVLTGAVGNLSSGVDAISTAAIKRREAEAARKANLYRHPGMK